MHKKGMGMEKIGRKISWYASFFTAYLSTGFVWFDKLWKQNYKTFTTGQVVDDFIPCLLNKLTSLNMNVYIYLNIKERDDALF